HHRLARGARPRRRARFLLYDASGQHPHLSAQPRTPGQSRGSGRPFLALRRSGLDFRFSALLSSLTMNNPPDISPVEHETEEYAHEVRRHVRGYLMVGATLLAFTANVDQRFSHCFYRLLDPAGVGNRLLLRLGRFDRGRAGLSDRGYRLVCLGRCADRLRRIVLSKNETAAFDHMKAILVSAVLF